ncbi:LysR substrate-binding domain-containing protein [Nioella aestuarii]|uniref:LysR substrate-binding domain-containing protein n=1 Tax=Nioella aestuarii TaxID=1662864 RepID=UPI003D7FA0D9
MSRRLPNLNQLRAFEAAARRLSFKDAADELNVTHAAISHQIKALEADLGLKLFHRMTRRVELTDPARDLAARLSRAFAEIRAATEAATAKDLTGEIRISMAPYFANRVILPYLADFHDLYPGLRVIPEMSSDVIDLRGSDCDAAVRYGNGDWPGMTIVKLYDDMLSAVAAPSLVSGRTLPLTLEEIARMVLGDNALMPEKWPEYFEAGGLTDPGQLTVVSYPDRARVNDMAISGAGVALVDRHLFAADVQAGRLLQLNPLEIQSEKSMYVVFAETEYPDRRVLAFANWLKGRFNA